MNRSSSLFSDAAALRQAALVGCDRPWALPEVTADDDAVARLLRELLAQAEAEGQAGGGQTLLRLAGALGWCLRAGWVAPPWPAEQAPPPEPPPERRRPAPPAWTALWAQVQALDERTRLQIEALQALAAWQGHAPPEVLIDLLALGRQRVALRPAVAAVLGERGRWLAAHHPDGAWAAGAAEQADEETRWQHGSLDQRVAVLRAQRATDPAAGLVRLQAAWSGLPARDRLALIDALLVGLGPDDEAFLNHQLLKDRSQDLRRCAADLLAALPGSAFGQRMAQRLAPRVRARPGERVALEVEAPPAPPAKAVLADDPHPGDFPDAERSVHERLGERAWCLHQLVRRSPLGWWTAHTGFTPEALLAAAERTDWTEALVRGWAHAALTQPDPDWSLALLDHPRIGRWGDPAALLAQLPAATREAHLNRRWRAWAAAPGKTSLMSMLDGCLRGLPADAIWGPTLSAAVAQSLRTALADGSLWQTLLTEHAARHTLLEAACALHPESLEALAALPTEDPQGGALGARLQTLHQVRALRQSLSALF